MDLRKNVKLILAHRGRLGQVPSSMTDLADYLSVDRGGLSRYLARGQGGGAARLSVELVASALGVTPDDVVFWEVQS